MGVLDCGLDDNDDVGLVEGGFDRELGGWRVTGSRVVCCEAAGCNVAGAPVAGCGVAGCEVGCVVSEIVVAEHALTSRWMLTLVVAGNFR